MKTIARACATDALLAETIPSGGDMDFVGRYRIFEFNMMQWRERYIHHPFVRTDDIIPENVLWLIEDELVVDICKGDQRVSNDIVVGRTAAWFHIPKGLAQEIKSCTRKFHI